MPRRAKSPESQQSLGWLPGTLRVLSGWVVVALALVLAGIRVAQAETEAAAPTAAEVSPANSASSAARFSGPTDAPLIRDREAVLPRLPQGYGSYDGGWVQFSYSPSIRERVQPLIAQADEVRDQLTARLGQPVLRTVRVYVARTPGEMATLAPAGGPVPSYAAGVAYPQLSLVLLTVNPVHAGQHHDLAEVFRHELAHLALHDAVKGRPIPRWFNEGFAVFASGESSLVRLQTLWHATLADRLLSLKQLEKTFPAGEVDVSVAYAEAADVLRFLVRRQDRHRFRALIRRYRQQGGFEDSLSKAYGTDLFTLEHEWREDVAKRYTFWPILFSGTVVWMGALGLFVWGYRRRRQENQATLARWAEEEAKEDAQQLRVAVPEGGGRLHIVLSRTAQPEQGVEAPARKLEVPKVEHEGRWHTLH